MYVHPILIYLEKEIAIMRTLGFVEMMIDVQLCPVPKYFSSLLLVL